jgi:hypothetical protein
MGRGAATEISRGCRCSDLVTASTKPPPGCSQDSWTSISKEPWGSSSRARLDDRFDGSNDLRVLARKSFPASPTTPLLPRHLIGSLVEFSFQLLHPGNHCHLAHPQRFGHCPDSTSAKPDGFVGRPQTPPTVIQERSNTFYNV